MGLFLKFVFNLIFGSDWTCFWCCSDLDFGVALTFVFVLVCIHFWLWFCTQFGVNLTGWFGLGFGVDISVFCILGLTLILELSLALVCIRFWRYFAFAFGVALHSLLALVYIHFGVDLILVFDLVFGVKLTLILVSIWF